MGGMKHYIAEGGFSQWLYKKVGETITVDGMTGKVVEKIDDTIPNHAGLPLYSNTSDFYIKLSEFDSSPVQIRIFENRKAVLDLDWDHEHKPYSKGHLHVHDLVINAKDKIKRKNGRAATDEETQKYGALIKKVAPNVQL